MKIKMQHVCYATCDTQRDRTHVTYLVGHDDVVGAGLQLAHLGKVAEVDRVVVSPAVPHHLHGLRRGHHL